MLLLVLRRATVSLAAAILVAQLGPRAILRSLIALFADRQRFFAPASIGTLASKLNVADERVLRSDFGIRIHRAGRLSDSRLV